MSRSREDFYRYNAFLTFDLQLSPTLRPEPRCQEFHSFIGNRLIAFHPNSLTATGVKIFEITLISMVLATSP